MGRRSYISRMARAAPAHGCRRRRVGSHDACSQARTQVHPGRRPIAALRSAFSARESCGSSIPDGAAPPRLLLDRETFTPKWAPNGRTLYFILPGSEQQVLAVNDDGSGERVVATLSGRRGSLGSNGLSTDGRHLYFTWEEDLGDLWTMDAQISRYRSPRSPGRSTSSQDSSDRPGHQLTTSRDHQFRDALIFSPSALTAATVTKMHAPGKSASHGSVLIVVCA